MLARMHAAVRIERLQVVWCQARGDCTAVACVYDAKSSLRPDVEWTWCGYHRVSLLRFSMR